MLVDFYLSRFWRIAPVFIFALFASVYARQDMSVDTFLLGFTMLFSISTPGLTSIVGGGWSLGVEWVFYAMFPMILLFRSVSMYFIVFSVTLVAGWRAASFALKASNGSELLFWYYHNQPGSFLPYFMGGVLAASISRTFSLTSYSRSCYIGSFLILLLIFAWPGIFHLSRQGLLTEWSMPILCIFAAIAVFLAAQSRPDGFVAKISKFLGDISYSLYLLHLLVMHYVMTWFPDARPWKLVLGTSVASLVLSWLVHGVVEKPVRSLGMKWSGGKNNDSAPITT